MRKNLSGNEAAVKLLSDLKKQYGFDYKIMINSEPHQKKRFFLKVYSRKVP